jgi:hypothetical protein
MANEDCSPEQNWPLMAAITPLYKEPRFRMCGAILPHPLHEMHTDFTGFS